MSNGHVPDLPSATIPPASPTPSPNFSTVSHFHPPQPSLRAPYAWSGVLYMNTSSRSAINRANAQHSTGPKSAEGKKASSLNALRHGLTGEIVVMPNEDLTAYELHVKSFTDDLQPVGAIEVNLVQALADTSWRLNRVTAFENNVQAYAVPGSDDPIPGGISVGTALESMSKTLSNLSLYTQRLSRQYEKAERHLRELQKVRKDQEQH